MNTLQNIVAAIKQVNSRIGLATAKLYLQEGAKLLLSGRRKEVLDDVAISRYGDFITVLTDISNSDDNEPLIKTIVDT